MTGELNYLTVKEHMDDLVRAAERARVASRAGTVRPRRRRRRRSMEATGGLRPPRAIGSARPSAP